MQRQRIALAHFTGMAAGAGTSTRPRAPRRRVRRAGAGPPAGGRPGPRMKQVYRRRRAVAGLVLLAAVAALLAVVLGGGEAGGGSTAEEAVAPVQELPGGGTQLFPERRVVSFYGAPQDEALGALGIGTPAEAAARLHEQAEPYDTEERPVLPALELIATIADAAPGGEDLYRTRQRAAVVREYLEAARAEDALLVLDIQPGRSDFMTEARALESFLEEPDVSLALDPEWRMGPEEVPGQTVGSVDASEVNEVARYLSGIVEREGLPEKLLLIHQFTGDMILAREELQPVPGVALTLNVDGFGGPDVKREKYRDLVRLDGVPSRRGTSKGGGREGERAGEGAAPRFPVGFKLFYEEDTDLLSPRQVLDMKPPPDVVVYE